MEKMKIIALAQTIYKKCECCSRVKDIFFKIHIYDARNPNLLVGDMDLCKWCGENFSDIINTELPDTDLTVTEFKFE